MKSGVCNRYIQKVLNEYKELKEAESKSVLLIPNLLLTKKTVWSKNLFKSSKMTNQDKY